MKTLNLFLEKTSTRNRAGVREQEPGASLASLEVLLTNLKTGGQIHTTHTLLRHTRVSIESGFLTNNRSSTAEETVDEKIKARISKITNQRGCPICSTYVVQATETILEM